jgi:hypothetical protein
MLYELPSVRLGVAGDVHVHHTAGRQDVPAHGLFVGQPRHRLEARRRYRTLSDNFRLGAYPLLEDVPPDRQAR